MANAKVLVVDANQDSRAALAHALTEAGYEAAVATSGSFALTMLEWEQPDLIVNVVGRQAGGRIEADAPREIKRIVDQDGVAEGQLSAASGKIDVTATRHRTSQDSCRF